MKHTRLRTSPIPIVLAFLLIGAIFALDLSMPPWLPLGVLYVAPVALIALWSPPTHYSLLIVVALACSVLTLGRLVYFTTDAPAWPAITNQLLAVGAFWAIVILSLLRKRMEQKTQWIDLLPRL
ncbi:hypothetical protein [Candidatus Nitrospira bockiana]